MRRRRDWCHKEAGQPREWRCVACCRPAHIHHLSQRSVLAGRVTGSEVYAAAAAAAAGWGTACWLITGSHEWQSRFRVKAGRQGSAAAPGTPQPISPCLPPEQHPRRRHTLVRTPCKEQKEGRRVHRSDVLRFKSSGKLVSRMNEPMQLQAQQQAVCITWPVI